MSFKFLFVKTITLIKVSEDLLFVCLFVCFCFFLFWRYDKHVINVEGLYDVKSFSEDVM